MMLYELLRLAEETDQERRMELQSTRLGARRLRARQRAERRTEDALMEMAWSRLC